MLPSDLAARTRALHWIALAAAILLVDYATGPVVQFSILFVLPVSLATLRHGVRTGIVVATVLPLLKLTFVFEWQPRVSWVLEGIDTAVDIAILGGLAGLIHQMLQQQRQIRVLQGLLPICGFCKRIREDEGHWRQLESFISERSPAEFSHTVCEACARTHYAGLLD